jgi:DNA-directed RNA polymerase specialized sigma24 family protein
MELKTKDYHVVGTPGEIKQFIELIREKKTYKKKKYKKYAIWTDLTQDQKLKLNNLLVLNMTMKEAAKRTNIPYPTVKSYVYGRFNGLKNLRRRHFCGKVETKEA